MHKVSNASINCKLIEECCIIDYLSVENNNYPDWNIQEQGKDWPDDVKKEHSDITRRSIKSKTKRTKARM